VEQNGSPAPLRQADSPAGPARTAAPDPAKAPRRPLWQRLLGIRRRKGKRIPFVPTKWGWCLVLLLMIGGGSLAFAEYSMQPEFCRSCHLMEPYYAAWHQSTHKNVPCADCHFEPGWRNTLKGKIQASSQVVKYLTNTYGSKPHAEVRDASCLREGCHDRRILEGKVNWEVASTRGEKVTIRFDHAPHLQEERRGKQLRCVSCHSQIVQGQHIVVTLDTCFLCHFKGLQHGRHEQTLGGCVACHAAPKEKIRLSTGLFDHGDYLQRGVTCENCHADSIKGDGAVPRQVCWNCHNQPSLIARYSDVPYMHSTHVSAHKVECSSCHVQIEHHLSAGAERIEVSPRGSRVRVEGGTCGQCHEQTHAGPAELYRGIGGRGVPDMPSPMYRTHVNCIACHKDRKQGDRTAEVVGQTFLAAQKSCNYCHANKYDGKLEEWKQTVARNLAAAEATYAQAKAALEKSQTTGMDRLRAQRLLDDADHNIRLVKLGHGAHNVNYSTALLSVAVENCREVMKAASPGVGPSGAPP